METRITRKGRVRPVPRIEPVYGTAKQRRERKKREAESRNAAYQRDITAERTRIAKEYGMEDELV